MKPSRDSSSLLLLVIFQDVLSFQGWFPTCGSFGTFLSCFSDWALGAWCQPDSIGKILAVMKRVRIKEHNSAQLQQEDILQAVHPCPGGGLWSRSAFAFTHFGALGCQRCTNMFASRPHKRKMKEARCEKSNKVFAQTCVCV